MKKSLSILLLLAFLFNTVGYVVYFYVGQEFMQEEARTATEQNLAPEKTEKLSLSENELNELSWEEENEFYYKGELYDVRSVTKTSTGETCIVCTKDAKEKNLVEWYVAHSKENNKEKNRAGKTLLKTDKTAYNESIPLLSFYEQKTENHPGFLVCFYPSVVTDLFSPPPLL